MMVVGPDGALVAVYDKHHLYCTVRTHDADARGVTS